MSQSTIRSWPSAATPPDFSGQAYDPTFATQKMTIQHSQARKPNVANTCLTAFVLGFLVILGTGCGEDTAIRSYSIAKPNRLSDTASLPDRPAQLLGAIVPNQESAWFLKMTDEPEKVRKLAADFRELAQSLSFSEDGTPKWQLAEGWEERVLKQITYAQFFNADGATVTLTQLGADTTDADKWRTYLLDNINRWRQQLGLSALDWSSIEPELEEVPSHSTDTAKAYFVSMVGRQSSTGGGGMLGAGPPMNRTEPASGSASPSPRSTAGASATPSPHARLVYQVPEGWQEQSSSGIRLASFQIPAESGEGTVSVSTAGGQLEQSVAMWIQQVGLEPADTLVQQLIDESISGTSSIGQYQCYTIDGSTSNDGGSSEEKGSAANVIRVAVIPLNDRENLFVKMTANKQLIDAERQRFDQFVQSLQWQ